MPSFGRAFVRFAVVALFTAAASPSFAGVTVTQEVGPAATSWPATPIVSTVTNPSGQAIVGESFTGGGGATSYGQTFTLPEAGNHKLESILLYVGGGTGTTPTAALRLNLYYLGGRTAPTPNAYSPGADLLGAGAGLAVTYTPQANGLLRLDFTAEDQVVLRAGRMYVFQISGNPGTSPVNWLRTTSDTYPGGAAYRSRAWINGTNARDFALAIYGSPSDEVPPPTRATVDASITHQRMDGFGAGVVFLDAGLSPLSDTQMDTLYGTGAGQFGLTLLRVRISPTGNFVDALENARKAYERGGSILASPWSPPPALKTNNNIVGGSLLPSEYGGYVAHLNGFLDVMATNGSPVAVVSLQNEPDIAVTYESAFWTPTEFQVFCRDYAGAIGAPVMMPESFRFDPAVSNPTLNDPAAAANVAYIGGHLYGTGVRDYPLARALGKPLWMTEYLVNDQTLSSALGTAEQITDSVTVGHMSAYIWWKTIGNANGLLNAAGDPQRRGFVMGQFSRFVRPGDVRVHVSGNTGPLALSAFRDPVSGRFAIVAVNNTTRSETQRFDLSGPVPSTVTPWMTSATQSLAAQSSVAVSGGSFTYELPAQSIVTFAGTITPVVTSAAAAGATVGEPFQYAVTATHAPTGYTAAGLPLGLAIDPASGIISGTPTAAGVFVATVAALNAGGAGTLDLTITIAKGAASATLADLALRYDGTPRVVTATTIPAGLNVVVTYDGQLTPPIYPGTYAVVAAIDDANYVGQTGGTLQVDITARVRHMTSLNGAIHASVQVLTAENTTLNGRAAITGDLLAPGRPGVRLDGQPTFDGAIDGPGDEGTSAHNVTLNGNASLRHLVRRIDAIDLPVVGAPAPPPGTRSVSLNRPGDAPGDFATLRHLTLNGNAGMVAIPAGTYGGFSANSGSGFVLGEAGATTAAVYQLQNLTLNGGSRIEIAGPVVLILAGGLSVNSGVTFSEHAPPSLELRLASGGLSVNGAVVLPATVVAPNGTVTLNGNATLRGTVKADRLIVNGNASLMAD